MGSGVKKNMNQEYIYRLSGYSNSHRNNNKRESRSKIGSEGNMGETTT